MKFGFSLQENYCFPMEQVIDLLAEAGFCAISPGWQRDGNLADTVRHAQAKNITLQSLHGPLRGMPDMWCDEPKPILNDLLDAATDCARLGFPILVVHPWNGVDYTFDPKKLCFDHFDTLVTHAEALGISIAFENLEGPEYLAALLERYVNHKHVGYCFDSGHEVCYSPGWDFLKLYGDRLIMTHLNDNLGVTGDQLSGTDDLHLLPGDGVLDWQNIRQRLQRAKPQEIWNFELKIRPKGNRCKLDLYSQLPLETYFREAYHRACNIFLPQG